MSRALKLIVAFLLSGLVSGMAQNLMAQWAGAREEFILAILILFLLTPITSVVLAIVLGISRSVTRGVFWIGAIVTVAGSLLLAWSLVEQGSARLVKADTLIVSYIVIPTWIMLFVQWLLLRPRTTAAK